MERLLLYSRWTRAGYRYDVEHAGEVIVSGSRDPVNDAARALLASGISGVAEIVDARTGVARMRFNIAHAARYYVVERDAGGMSIEPWRPRPSVISDGTPLSGVSHSGGRGVADKTEQPSVTADRRRDHPHGHG